MGIGPQDTTINCAAGGPVVRELKLLDKSDNVTPHKFSPGLIHAARPRASRIFFLTMLTAALIVIESDH